MSRPCPPPLIKRDWRSVIALGFVVYTSFSLAQTPSTLRAFTPASIPTGVIRSRGDDAMHGILIAWQTAFRHYHPEITFAETLNGSGTGMAGIITSVSDLSLMGRPATANEIMGFEWVFRYKPIAIPVASGALVPVGAPADEKSRPLLVYVPNDNPLQQVSMAQLKAFLECRREAVTWSLAGAGGKRANRPIHAYLYDSETGTGAFLQRAILGKEDRWNWEVVKEFKDKAHKNGKRYLAAQQIIDEVKKDPDGIGISASRPRDQRLKVLAVAAAGPPVLATTESLSNGTYPLERQVYIYVNRAPGKAVDPKVREFVRFILSEEGQRLVHAQGDFLPLPPAIAADAFRDLK
ncbi:MAG TPA: substrate-binding domain-containing protein [Acidobacteriaceae bacterium]|jgi:phosphate transport system substrate-binding protein